jgi:hypothetical protein
VRGLDGNFDLTVGPKTCHGAHKVSEKESKSYFFRPLCVILGRRCEKNCTLRQPTYLPCFRHILRVLARPFSRSKWIRECSVHQKVSFEFPLPTSNAKVTPKVAPRRAQVSPKGPRGRQKTPPRHLKTIKKSACDPTWSSKAAREARCKHGSRNEM